MSLMGRLTTFRCNMSTVQDHMPNHACHYDDQLFLPLDHSKWFRCIPSEHQHDAVVLHHLISGLQDPVLA